MDNDQTTRPGAGTRDGGSPARPRWVGPLLWVVAVAVMLGAAVYQRRTGPTYPYEGTLAVAGDTTAFELVRSQETPDGARVAIVAPDSAVAGTVFFRRYPTEDPFTASPLRRHGDTLVAVLPVQPAAGKLEYRLEVSGPDRVVRIPDGDEDTIILRYKDPVPLGVLLPHVLFMFFAILIGVRAGLGAMAGTAHVRRWAWTALGLMTVGGMILGPLVQKSAFGKFWTGWPNGYDLTDNKTLIMWLVWVVACAVLGLRRKAGSRERGGRAVVIVATIVMLAVYLVPHSMRGSELDYGQVDQGVDPAEAIETGQ